MSNIEQVVDYLQVHFNQFCKEGYFINADQEQLASDFTKFTAVWQKDLLKLESSLQGKDFWQELEDYLLANDYALDLTIDPVEIDEQEQFVVFLGLYQVNSTRNKTVSFNHFYQDFLGYKDFQFPEIKVFYVGNNLLKEFHLATEKFLNLDIEREWSFRAPDKMLIWEEHLQRLALERDLPLIQIEKIIMANELGHAFFYNIFQVVSAEEWEEISFEDGNNKEYDLWQLSEALSDITELKYGCSDWSEFQQSLAEKIEQDNTVVGYQYSCNLLKRNFKELYPQTELSTLQLNEKEFAVFIKNFLNDRVLPEIFGVIAECEEYLVEERK